MPPVRVKITKQDIREGRRFSAFNSPCALALNRHCPVKDACWCVGPTDAVSYATKGSGARRVMVKLPREVADWQLAHNAEKPVEAIEFEVEVTEVTSG